MFTKLKKWLLGKVLRGTIRKAAEGGYGPRVQKIYWWCAGKKTWTGVILFSAAEVLPRLQAHGLCGTGNVCTDVSVAILGPVGLFLVGVGLLDDTWRDEPPKEPSK